MAAKDNPGLPVDFMGVDRVSLAASERDRDDRSKSCDDPSSLSAAPFQTRMNPPVAMSLRTRESSSLALKLIFDQINASAENPQPLESVFDRTAGISDNRDDNGKRDGPGVLKELSGMVRSAGSEPDVWQRTGGVHGPRNQGLEDRNSFHFKNYSAGWGEEVKGQQMNRGTPPQSFAEREHSRSQLTSEKDLRYGFRSPERTVSPLRQDASGSVQYTHKAPQVLANDSPQSRGIASPPQDVHLRKRLPELDLSFQKSNSQDSAAFLPTQTAFGSPISAPSHQSLSDNTDVHNSTASWSIHGIQQGSLPQAASRPSTVNALGRLATAQLTIFYSGRVNVYDDVPVDKANAIMLLAGNGNSWSTNFRTTPPPERERTLQVMSPPATQPTQPSVAVPANVLSGTVGTPSVAANASPGSSASPTAPPADPKPQTPAKRPHSGIELPHARKASLARFLEKRKDRVQVKPQGEGEGEGQENRELGSERPCSPKKQRSVRSRSPSPTRSVHGIRGAMAAPRRFD